MLTREVKIYDFGQTVPCYGLFVDKVSGAAYTPTEVVFQFGQSGDEPTEYVLGTDAELANEALPADVLAELLPSGVTSPSGSTGQFRVYVLPDASGSWYYRFKSLDEGEESATEWRFSVRPSVLDPEEE